MHCRLDPPLKWVGFGMFSWGELSVGLGRTYLLFRGEGMARRLILPIVLIAATVAGCVGGRNAAREDTARSLREAAARALQQRMDTPRRCLFGFGLSPSLYISALSPRASDSGLRKGDRVVSVGGVKISSFNEFFGAIANASVGDSIAFEVTRGRNKGTVSVPCHDPRSMVNAEQTLFTAAARGDWDGCIAASLDYERALGVVLPGSLGWRLRCLLEKQGHRVNNVVASLVYDFWRLRLQAAAYEPDGVAPLRGQILGVTTSLRRDGFIALAEDLERQLASARDFATASPPQAESPAGSQGTAFAITPDGLFLTAAHVIDGGKTITLRCPGRNPVYASAVQIARNVDLATLRAPLSDMAYVPFAEARSVRSGEPVFTVGFPAPDILGYESKFTDGSISALSGRAVRRPSSKSLCRSSQATPADLCSTTREALSAL